MMRTYARVRVVLDVPLSQPWEAEEKAEVVFNRAKAQASQKVKQLIGEENIKILDMRVQATIVEETEK